MNDFVLFLDGIGDYSVIQKINRIKVPSKYFPFLTNILKKRDLKTIYLDARLEAFSQEIMDKTISDKNPLAIIINMNFDNIQQISRLKILKTVPSTKVFFISDNFDRAWLSYIKNIHSHQLIVRKKTDNLDEFLQKILDSILQSKKDSTITYKISHNVSIENLTPDWGNINEIKKYTPVLNIGTGCSRSCSFCSQANTNVVLRDIDLVMDEIKFFFEKGISYFHIGNHNFSTDLNYLERFCEKLMSRFYNKNFVWSCFGIPEFLIKDKNIFSILKKSKLGRLELSIESGISELLAYYDIDSNENIIKEIVEEAFKNDIPSILGNIIIGSPLESEATFNRTLKFLKQLINIAPGCIEFNNSFFQPDVGSKLYKEKNFECNTSKKYMQRGFRKINCMYETKQLNTHELTKFNQQLNKDIHALLRDSVSKMSQGSRLTHINYYNMGLCTQYFFHFLSRSSSAALQQLYEKNRFVQFSTDIEHEIENYAPFLLGKVVKKDNKDILIFDPILSTKNYKPYFQISQNELRMIQFADGKRTIEEILNSLSDSFKNNEKSKIKLLNFYKKLESKDLLIYTKILN